MLKFRSGAILDLPVPHGTRLRYECEPVGNPRQQEYTHLHELLSTALA